MENIKAHVLKTQVFLKRDTLLKCENTWSNKLTVLLGLGVRALGVKGVRGESRTLNPFAIDA